MQVLEFRQRPTRATTNSWSGATRTWSTATSRTASVVLTWAWLEALLSFITTQATGTSTSPWSATFAVSVPWRSSPLTSGRDSLKVTSHSTWTRYMISALHSFSTPCLPGAPSWPSHRQLSRHHRHPRDRGEVRGEAPEEVFPVC